MIRHDTQRGVIWTEAPWTVLQAVLGWLAFWLRLADTALSRYAEAQGMVESNFILGRHPSLAWNLTYLVLTLILLWGVAFVLNGRWRLAWLGGYAAVEAWSLACYWIQAVCWVHLFHVPGW